MVVLDAIMKCDSQRGLNDTQLFLKFWRLEVQYQGAMHGQVLDKVCLSGYVL